MATIIEVHTPGGTSRRCDSTCHDADKNGKCGCVCGGAFHGVGSANALALSPEAINEVRESMALDAGEHVQLRIGA